MFPSDLAPHDETACYLWRNGFVLSSAFYSLQEDSEIINAVSPKNATNHKIIPLPNSAGTMMTAHSDRLSARLNKQAR